MLNTNTENIHQEGVGRPGVTRQNCHLESPAPSMDYGWFLSEDDVVIL